MLDKTSHEHLITHKSRTCHLLLKLSFPSSRNRVIEALWVASIQLQHMTWSCGMCMSLYVWRMTKWLKQPHSIDQNWLFDQIIPNWRTNHMFRTKPPLANTGNNTYKLNHKNESHETIWTQCGHFVRFLLTHPLLGPRLVHFHQFRDRLASLIHTKASLNGQRSSSTALLSRLLCKDCVVHLHTLNKPIFQAKGCTSSENKLINRSGTKIKIRSLASWKMLPNAVLKPILHLSALPQKQHSHRWNNR